jgi:putative two-component system response regulator
MSVVYENISAYMIPVGSPPQHTVLVIDDEAGPRDALKVILRPFFTIRAADNAKSALDVLNNEPIDLVTLDQRLPDRHGLELLHDIKHDHPDVEVVIVTGYGSLKSAMEGIRQGAAGYLLKPFNVTELIALTQQTLEKKRRLDFLRWNLRSSPELWELGERQARAWDAINSEYCTLYMNAGRNTMFQEEEMALVPMLSDILEATDRHLLNHSSRVSFYSTLMAARLNLTVAEQRFLATGAFLHDIGKTSFPAYRFSEDQILPSGKPRVCAEHCERGARLATTLGLPTDVHDIIAYHHERWDGRGYPHGLSGTNIPILARLVGIAQVFDHLTADAPGRACLSAEAAIQQISLAAGSHFDPQLLDLFIEVAKQSAASLPAMTVVPAA